MMDTPMRALVIAALLGLVATWPCASAARTYTAAVPTALQPWATCTVVFSPPRPGTTTPVFRRVPVAVSADQQHTGLKVPASGGLPLMLFAWPAPSFYPFWMEHVGQPLSVAFIDATGRVSRITAMAPDSQTWYWPPSTIRAAMEAPTPLFATAGVKVGWLFHVEHCSVAALRTFQLPR